MKARLILAATAALVTACGGSSTHETGGDASAATINANAAVAASLPLADQQDFEDARRGFVGVDDPAVFAGPGGRPAWDLCAYAVVQGDAPPTANPSLW